MMKSKSMCLLLVFLWSGSIVASGTAPAPFEILTPVVGGSGCKDNSAFAKVLQDDRLIQFQFNDFIVEAGGGTSIPLARKNCGLSIPVQVNPGYRVALPVVELSGLVEAATIDEAQLMLDVEIFFAGQEGSHFKKQFSQNENFQLTIGADESRWSDCGQAVNLRINMNALAKSASRKIVSRLNLKNGMTLPLKWKRC